MGSDDAMVHLQSMPLHFCDFRSEITPETPSKGRRKNRCEFARGSMMAICSQNEMSELSTAQSADSEYWGATFVYGFVHGQKHQEISRADAAGAKQKPATEDCDGMILMVFALFCDSMSICIDFEQNNLRFPEYTV